MCLVADRGIDCLHQILNRSYIRIIGPLKRRTSPHSSPKVASRSEICCLLQCLDFTTEEDFRAKSCYEYTPAVVIVVDGFWNMLDMFDSKSGLSWVSNNLKPWRFSTNHSLSALQDTGLALALANDGGKAGKSWIGRVLGGWYAVTTVSLCLFA